MGAHGGRHDAARKEQLINAFMGSEFRALLQLVVDILLRTAGVIHPDMTIDPGAVLFDIDPDPA